MATEEEATLGGGGDGGSGGAGDACAGDEEAEFCPASAEQAADEQKNEKDKGNVEYQQGNYDAAVKAWGRSLSSVKYILEKGVYKDKQQELEEVYAMELRLNLNIAQGYMKLEEWNNVVTHADKALARDGQNAKALYRKAYALVQLLSFDEACAVLERLLRVEPQNAAAKKMLAEAQRNLQVSERRAKKMSQKMFNVVRNERDPRSKSWREALWHALRSIPGFAWSWTFGVPGKIFNLMMALLTMVRAQLEPRVNDVREHLRAFGLLLHGTGAGSKGGEAPKQ